MITEERLRWAEALKIEQLHGADAACWIAERVAALALAGDRAGVDRFRAIAERLDRIEAGRRHRAS